MNYTCKIEDYTFELSFDNSTNDSKEAIQLKVYAINNTNMKDYEVSMNNSICKDHVIIKNITMLYKMLVDGFNKSSDDICLEVIFEETCIVCNLTIKYPYIEDSIKLELKLIKDLKDFATIDHKITHINKKFGEVESNTKSIIELFNVIETLKEEIKYLKQGTQDVVNYITIPNCVSVCTDKHNNGVFKKDDILLDDKTIKLGLYGKNNGTTTPYEIMNHITGDPNVRYYVPKINTLYTSFDTNEFIHLFIKMISLRNITINNLTIRNLYCFTNNNQLTTLSIENCEQLTSISHINQFESLEKLTIKNCSNIKNLHVLEDHPSLKELRVQNSMNTNVFSKNINFKITIIT